jgi:membrane fusion protein (multidrug efflux system)
MSRIPYRSTFLWIIPALALTAGCSKKPAAGGGPGLAAVQVIAIKVKRQPVSEKLSLIGNIAANEMVEIKAETEGVVEEINFSEGQRVEKGSLLLKLDETKLAASLAQAEANHQLAQATYERAKQLSRDKLISQQDYDQTASGFAGNEATVQLTRRQLKDARVYAPFSGVAGARQISPGQVVTRNTLLTTLVDLDIVKVEVKIPEKYLGQVQTGQKLDFKVAAFPNDTFTGEVYFISPQLDESTRTALVKARIKNQNARLKGGMFAGLELTVRLKEDALVIPEPALINSGDTMSVFTVDAKTNAVVKQVKIGLRLTGKAEVLEGLKEGDLVVVEGVQKLRPGAPVKLAPPEAGAPYQ